MKDKLTFEDEDTVAIIALDDGKVNAAGFEMLDAINGALDRALAESQSVVLLGRPGILSGGFDLKVINGGDEAELKRLLHRGVSTIMRLYGHPQPLVIAATGHAIALGALMLLASDYRFGASGDFKIGLNETAIGLTLPLFGIELAQARLSPLHLTEAAIGAQLYAPQAAIEAGFLDAVVEGEAIRASAIDKARAMTALDAAAFAATKRGFRGKLIERVMAELG